MDLKLTEATRMLAKETAGSLKGYVRRLFMARTVRALGPGGQNLAEKEFGWSGQTIRKGEPGCRMRSTTGPALCRRDPGPSAARCVASSPLLRGGGGGSSPAVRRPDHGDRAASSPTRQTIHGPASADTTRLGCPGPVARAADRYAWPCTYAPRRPGHTARQSCLRPGRARGRWYR